MKHVKSPGLAAMAAMALMVFGAGSASAAELYSTGVTVNAGTNVVGSLESGTSTLTTTDGKTIVDTCTGSSVNGTVNAYTGGDATVAISALTWTGCSVKTETLTNGALGVSSLGTVTGTGSVVTVGFGGVSCRYGTGTGTHLGSMGEAKLAFNAVVNEQEPKSFLCPDTTKWVANYTLTSPHALTVNPEEVKVELTAPKFKVGEELNVAAKNIGNVQWTVTWEEFHREAGSWETPVAPMETCKPSPISVGNQCTRPLKCLKAVPITWTISVKSANGTKAEKALKIECN